MTDPSSRMLRLLSLLQTHRHWTGPDLADRLRVSVRTLRRDVDRLRDLGYPVEAARGVDGGYQLAPGAALPPLVIDDDEAVAIAIGMQAAAQGAVAGIEEAAVRALTRVTQVMPPPLRRRVDAVRSMTVPAGTAPGPPVAADVLITAALACRDTERLRFGYTPRGGEPAERLVEPHRLVPLQRRWYLVGYDLARQDWRSFRLDRMTDPVRTSARFRPRPLPADDAAAFVRAGIAHLPMPYTVEVRVAAPAATVRERAGRWWTVEDDGPSRCRLRTSTDALEWPALSLGLLGAEFEVVTPPELAELLHEWGARFARA